MEQKKNPADWIKQAVRALFLFFAVWILGLSLGTIQLKESMEAFGKGPWLTIALLGGSLTLFLVFYLFAKVRWLQEEKYAGLFILLCIAAIGILQILCIFKLRIRFRYDALEVYEEACRLLKTGQIANWDYFGANPHQRGTLYITWFLLKIAASLHIPESMYMVYLDLWCMICVDSCILGAGFVVGREKGLRVMTLYFFLMLLQPFTYMWCLFHYTTVQCLPFMMLLLLLAGVAPQCRRLNQKILLGVVTGVICFIGNKIRPTVLIVLIAYVLYVGLQWIREWIRKYQMQKETEEVRQEEEWPLEQMADPERTGQDEGALTRSGRKKADGFQKKPIRKVIRPEQIAEPEPVEKEPAAKAEAIEESEPAEEETVERKTEVLKRTEKRKPAGKEPEKEESKPEEVDEEQIEEPEQTEEETVEREAEVSKRTEKRKPAGKEPAKEKSTQSGEEVGTADPVKDMPHAAEYERKNKKSSKKRQVRKEAPVESTTDGDHPRAENSQRRGKKRSGKRGRPKAAKRDTLERMEKILNETEDGTSSVQSEKKDNSGKKSPKVMSASKRDKTIRKTERLKPFGELADEDDIRTEEGLDLELTVDAEELENDFGDVREEIFEEPDADSDEEFAGKMQETESVDESEGDEAESDEEIEEAEAEFDDEIEEVEAESDDEIEEAEAEYGDEIEEAEAEAGEETEEPRRQNRPKRRSAQEKEKIRMYGNLAAVAAFVLTFLLLSIGYKALDRKMVTIDTSSYERPLLFWVAMSAKGDGTWDGNDAEQLAKFETKEEKEAYTKELIQERLGDLGMREFLGLMSRKLRVTWAEGNDDAISENTDSLQYGKWYDRLLGEDSLVFLYYCQIFRILMFACIAAGTVCAFARRSIQSSDYMRIVLLGGILFHLLWEAKPLYSLPFMPFLLVLMTEGLWQLLEALGVETAGDRLRSLRGGRRNKERISYPVIALSVLAWLCLMIWGFGYGQQLLKQERTIRNYTASQAMERCDIKRGLLKTEAVRQEFRADRPFNTIGVQTRNYSWFYGKENESLYRLTVLDSEDQVLRQALIKGSEFEDYEYCDVSFEPVVPQKGGELYRFLIETVKADDISYLVFYKKASDAIDPYPWGDYVENGVPMEQADLTFRVYQKEYGPVMAKKDLLFLILPQLFIQFGILCLSLPGKEESGIRRGNRKRKGFSGKDRLI